jgi:hypothetical protein
MKLTGFTDPKSKIEKHLKASTFDLRRLRR